VAATNSRWEVTDARGELANVIGDVGGKVVNVVVVFIDGVVER
jgi:hypothetical protein